MSRGAEDRKLLRKTLTEIYTHSSISTNDILETTGEAAGEFSLRYYMETRKRHRELKRLKRRKDVAPALDGCSPDD